MSQRVLAHQDVGTGGTPVVLLHAFPLDRRMWRRQLDALSTRAVVPDLRGFGASPGVGGSVDDHADELCDLLDALSIERAVVAGLSMGGYVAMAFARRHASRLAGLLLADTKAGPDNDEAKKGREANIERARNEGAVAVFDAMRPKVFTPRTDRAHVEELRAIAASQSTEGVVAALEMMRDRPDATGALADIHVPTTIVVGSDDAATPPSEAEFMARAIAGAKLVSIEKSGHFSNVEGASEFNRALLELLVSVRL